MKKVLFLTNGIHSMSNGRSIASYGYCLEFSKYTELKAFAPVPYNVDVDEVYKKIDATLDVEFCQEDKRNLLNFIPRIWEKVVAKKIGIIETIKPNTYAKIRAYLKCNHVDIVIVDHLALARLFFKLKKEFPQVIYVYNSHNAEGVNYYQQLTGKDCTQSGVNKQDFNSIIDVIKCRYIFNMEKRMLNETDYSIAISKNDREVLCKQYNIKNEKILHTKPLAKFNRIKQLSDMKKFNYNLLIVGSMGWYPNVRGILWFVENVFNGLIKDNPRYKLYIVGRGPVQELKDIAAQYPENIILTGEVESTEPYFDMCDISIVPVFEGTGIKIKVLESMARGIPTICSSFAAKDYDFNNEVIVAETAKDYRNAIHLFESSNETREKCYQGMESYCAEYYNLTEDMKRLFKV